MEKQKRTREESLEKILRYQQDKISYKTWKNKYERYKDEDGWCYFILAYPYDWRYKDQESVNRFLIKAKVLESSFLNKSYLSTSTEYKYTNSYRKYAFVPISKEMYMMFSIMGYKTYDPKSV